MFPAPIPSHFSSNVISSLFNFQFKKQNENKAHYQQERKQAHEKAACGKLIPYEPPTSLYAPPVQFYDKNRPYFQEYIKYRNELNPVVMPIFTQAKGSIRAMAKSSFMPKKDPSRVSKRDELFAQRTLKLRQEEREGEKIKAILRSKKQRETQRLREERQVHALASPIKAAAAASWSSRPSTGGFSSPRSSASGGPGLQHSQASRPGTCNSFSPAALKTSAYARPDYPTAGTIWITDV